MKATSDLSTKASSDGYNKTQLNVDQDMERHIFHRDRLAHFFRWAHVMRGVKPVQEVLVDLGCGTGNLATMLYANRMKPHLYLGVDIRSKALERTEEYFQSKSFPAQFIAADLCKDGWEDEVNKICAEQWESGKGHATVITSFEFIEHIPGDQVEPFLLRAKKLMGPHTRFLLSTPCFDGVRKAENHIKEWYYQELKDLLEKHFVIEDHWGTFISQKDLEPLLESNEHVKGMWARLKTYYGSETMAILFAPLFPASSRNCIWRLALPETK